MGLLSFTHLTPFPFTLLSLLIFASSHRVESGQTQRGSILTGLVGMSWSFSDVIKLTNITHCSHQFEAGRTRQETLTGINILPPAFT